MASNKDSVGVAFILGVCLLQCGSASISINMVAYNGQVGHATSYNYPFKYSHDTGTYTYKLFADNASVQKLCLTLRQFVISSNSRLTINVPTSSGTMQYDYDWQGECTSNDAANSPLPENLWTQPFCVNLKGERFLEFTLHSESSWPSVFYFEYQPTTYGSKTPCGPGLFSCYNRECVSEADVCTDNTACTDLSHNTYAHAFCKDYDDTPRQQSGFWAHNLETSILGAITADSGWVFAQETNRPSIGPQSDHTTGYGMFLQTHFISTRYDLKMTFKPGKLVQKENCLSFWYYMDGPDPGKLVAEWGITEVWQRAGRYGAKWLQAQANLFCEESGLGCDKTVKITASKGSNPDTRISVDDISVMPGLCPFYEADVVKDAWTTDDGCSFLNGRLICSSMSARASAHTESWLVSRGKCLVGKVIFDYNINPAQTLLVFKHPVVGLHEEHLKTIRQSIASQKVRFKIQIDLPVPAKIGFTTIFNKGRISLEDIHVVDNECNNIRFVDEVLPTVNPSLSPPPASSGTISIIGIVIGVVVAICVSVVTVAVFLHKRYCTCIKPTPQGTTRPQPYVPPVNSEGIGPTSPQPPPYTSQVTNPPPYSLQPPPAYGEVIDMPSGHPK